MLSTNQIAVFFKMLYLNKEVHDDVYFWHADKHWTLHQADTINLGLCNQNAQSTQNKKFAYLWNISRKAWGDEVGFLPADKQESFLQIDSIILGVRSHVYPEYPKQQLYNIFAISQGKRERWSWFFAWR